MSVVLAKCKRNLHFSECPSFGSKIEKFAYFFFNKHTFIILMYKKQNKAKQFDKKLQQSNSFIIREENAMRDNHSLSITKACLKNTKRKFEIESAKG